MVVVDDHPEVRNALKLLLHSVRIDAEAYGSADEFLAAFSPDSDPPALVLLDVRMPGMSGMALLEQLRTQCPALPVIMITGHGDIDMAVRAMKLGATDFITKPFSAQALLDRIQDVLRRAAEAEGAETAVSAATSRLEYLSAREREVFDRIVAGQSNKAIAINLGISVRTVESHRARVMDKLQAKSLVDLVLLSVEDRGVGA